MNMKMPTTSHNVDRYINVKNNIHAAKKNMENLIIKKVLVDTILNFVQLVNMPDCCTIPNYLFIRDSFQLICPGLPPLLIMVFLFPVFTFQMLPFPVYPEYKISVI